MPDLTPPPAADGDQDSSLGQLNRHWYRRCLDALDADLRRVGDYPTVEQVRDLCGRVVHGFLTAVAGHAPDAVRLQFPADRAYYLPFQGDNAGQFGFAKAFYRFPRREVLDTTLAFAGAPWQTRNLYGSSLWAVYPWVPDRDWEQAPDGAEDRDAIRIDNELWRQSEGAAVPLGEMLSIRNLFRLGDEARAKAAVDGVGRKVAVQKAVYLMPPEDRLLEELLRSEKAVKDLRALVGESLAAAFDLFRTNPGNIAVEHWLSNHLNFLRWLAAGLAGRDGGVPPLSHLEDAAGPVFTALVAAYFGFGEDNRSDNLEEAKKRKLFFTRLEQTLKQGDTKADNTADAARFMKSLSSYAENFADSPFVAEVGKDVDVRYLRGGDVPAGDDAARKMTAALGGLINFFGTFWDFLRRQSEAEERLAADLTASLGPGALWAGSADRSFVAVTRDFPTVPDTIFAPFGLKNDDVNQRLFGRVTAAYAEFFRLLDGQLVRHLDRQLDRQRLIRDYWRTEGVPSRKPLVFGSFQKDGDHIGLAPVVGAMPTDPRPQNLFLRVCIRDTTNEPLVNGLFVVTADYDEVAFRGKDKEVRNVEDVEDLFTFAKVYFFVVRDFIRGLDQARVARDIGRLNQELFDKRLAKLEEVMAAARDEFQAGGGSAGGLTARRHWPDYLHRVVNHYAASLLEKDPQVRIETFPFDRLLVLPFGADPAGDDPRFQLPFFLFQAIFLERKDGEIVPDRYSLVKPFQSPVERLEEATGLRRFTSRSFQQQSEVDGRAVPREVYLEKRYVGTEECAGRPPSHVPWAFGADPARELGREWARAALAEFWRALHPADDKRVGDPSWRDLWGPFLRHLTREYRRMTAAGATEQPAQVFWFRMTVLAAVVQYAAAEDRDARKRGEAGSKVGDALESIRKKYERDLRVLFDDDRSADVLRFAEQLTPARVNERLTKRAAPGDSDSGGEFVPFRLGADGAAGDAFVLRLLDVLSACVANKASADSTPAIHTRYQRSLRRSYDGTKVELHQKIAKAIGVRRPADLAEKCPAPVRARGYIGLVNLTVGGDLSERDRRHLSYVVVLLRDYDEATFGSQSEGEAKDQIENDCRDLRLYTDTFFQNVRKFATDALRSRQVQVLSQDINQIARSWYTAGVDSIVRQVQGRIDDLLRGSTTPDLGRLHPQVLDQFAEAVLSVVLGENQPVRRVGGGPARPIGLESFPFDRFLHVPLGPEPGRAGGAEHLRLAYVRTTIRARAGAESEWAADGKSQAEVYDLIRLRGRVWDAEPEGGEKVRAFPVCHVGGGDQRSESDRPPWREPLAAWAERLAAWFDGTGPAGGADETELIRRLYQADALQALAVAGSLLYVLRQLGRRHRAADRLRAVIDDRIRALERVAADGAVVTAAEMDGNAWVAAWADVWADRAAAGRTPLPGLYELFEALEEARSDFRYGLANGDKPVASKVFFVYYSIPLPDAFAESVLGDGRYRGVFTLVVDDASTDVKDEEGAETDRADIRTFVHNAVSNLRLLFQQQALQNQLRQPGVEESITGMLHKLKNDLGRVTLALDTTGKVLERWPAEADQGDKQAVAAQFRSARGVVDGIQEVFNQLKKLSDLRREEICLSQLSTDWLGWQFVVNVCRAVLGPLGELGGDRAAAAGRAIQDMLTDAVARFGDTPGRAALSDDQDWDRLRTAAGADEHEAVRERLRVVQEHLTDVTRDRTGRPGDRVLLGFDVFHTGPLTFQASQLFCEAFHILIENALQAVWQYAARTAGPAPVTYRLGVVCRPTPEGEVVIELHNTGEVPDVLLKLLNDKPPKPVSRTIHQAVSRKKGGSGFGHYFARRIVSDFCGGPQARRHLDVEIAQPDRSVPAVVCRVRLLGSLTAVPSWLPSRRVGESLRKVFPADRDGGWVPPADADAEVVVPQTVDPDRLARCVADVLRTEHERRLREFMDFLTGAPMYHVNTVPNLFATAAGAALGELSGPPPTAAAAGLTPGSFTFPKLAQWLAEHRAVLPALADVPDDRWRLSPDRPRPYLMAKRIVERFLRDGALTLADLIPDDRRASITNELRQPKYAALLTAEITPERVDGLVRQLTLVPESGTLAIAPEVLRPLLKPFRCGYTRSEDRELSLVTYDFRIGPGTGVNGSAAELRPLAGRAVIERLGDVGRWFNRYHDLLAALPDPAAGSLRLLGPAADGENGAAAYAVRLILSRGSSTDLPGGPS